MTDVQAILREIVSDLEKTATSLTVLSAQVLRISPTSGIETQQMTDKAYENNKPFYEGLRKKIDALT
jgi:hypothetical protein